VNEPAKHREVIDLTGSSSSSSNSRINDVSLAYAVPCLGAYLLIAIISSVVRDLWPPVQTWPMTIYLFPNALPLPPKQPELGPEIPMAQVPLHEVSGQRQVSHLVSSYTALGSRIGPGRSFGLGRSRLRSRLCVQLGRRQIYLRVQQKMMLSPRSVESIETFYYD
jgi:hypothetical protein